MIGTRGTARCQKKGEEERTKEVVVFIDILFFEKEKATKSHTVQYLYLKERDEIGATNGKIYVLHFVAFLQFIGRYSRLIILQN